MEGGHCLTDALVQHDGSHGEYFSEQRQTPYVYLTYSSMIFIKLIISRPSSLVLSVEGQKAQKKIWDETMTLLKKEMPALDTTVVA